ncbi:MAG: gfo/Idh/MocA family oxidoreductase, partial [Planctomycetaceae bacterium]|nr:gfo/Idh/MocA family oxidoreductase [Planctomycetaceae bacterium]
MSKKIGSEYEKLSGKPFGNFIDVVRSRDKSKIEGPILEAHLSAALCHLGNISYRLGEVAPVASVKSAF